MKKYLFIFLSISLTATLLMSVNAKSADLKGQNVLALEELQMQQGEFGVICFEDWTPCVLWNCMTIRDCNTFGCPLVLAESEQNLNDCPTPT